MSSFYPDRVFDGKIIQLSPVMDGINQTTEIVVGLKNPQGLLKPGMRVRIQVVGHRGHVPALP